MATKYISLTNLDTFLGQLKTNYKASKDYYGGIKIDTSLTTGKNYAVQLDSNGGAYVNVPWSAGETYKLPVATGTVLGGVKIEYNGGKSIADATSVNSPLLLESNTRAAYVKISAADVSNAGLMSATDKKKLDGIAEGANKYTYTHPAAGANTGSFGQSTTVTLTHGGTFSVPYVTVNNSGHVTAISTKTLTLPETEGSSGGGMVSILYADLKDARDKGKLVPGTKYRITDYKTIVGSGNYNSTEKKFDIIVEALSECELSENAKACWNIPKPTSASSSSESTNFANYHFSNSDLTAWELKYCIDNDDNKFEWANKTSGTGVIYYMKDEWGNEAPYDFKNIRFKNSNNSTDNNYFFTFSKLAKTSSGYSIYDASTIYNGDTHAYETMPFATHNVIKPCYNSEYPVYTSANTNGTKTKLRLNQIVCVYTQNLSFNNGNDIVYNNYFDTNCYNIWILGAPNENKFGKNCRDIVIGGPTSSYNNFGNNCTNIKLAAFNYTRNPAGSGSTVTEYKQYIQHNNFGNNCCNIILGESCSFNVFGNNCGNWKAGTYFIGNKIGDNCCAWEFGNHCSKNVMVDNNYTTKYGAGLDTYTSMFAPNFNNTDTYAKILANSGNSTANWVCDCYFGEQSHAQITLCYNHGYDYPIEDNFDEGNILRFVYFTNLAEVGNVDDIISTPQIRIMGDEGSGYGGWAGSHVMRLAAYNEDHTEGGNNIPKYQLVRRRLVYNENWWK